MMWMEDDDDMENNGEQKDGRHHGSGEVALFSLMLCQAIFMGKQAGD